jgi:hypothetical protein
LGAVADAGGDGARRRELLVGIVLWWALGAALYSVVADEPYTRGLAWAAFVGAGMWAVRRITLRRSSSRQGE